MYRNRLIVLLSVVFMLMSGFYLTGQDMGFNHPELSWRTIETEHFFVHYHNGTDRTAALVAKISEEIYEPITTLYGYEPDTKIHYIIKDYDDYANGAAYYYDNKIEFWAPAALDFPFRGEHSWLRNTITHEFSHMISLGAARKFPRQIPAIYFQWLAYEKEKRKDVIHGYPNTLVSVPFPGTVAPMWFAEGMAQYQRAGLDYETWDTHRDMLLRTAVLTGTAHELTDMGYFSKNSLGNERVYNQGYGLTLYIASRYGESSLKDLTRAMQKKLRIRFSRAAQEALGLTDQELYDAWMGWLQESYSKNIQTVRDNRVEGRVIDNEGLANFYAVWSPDGRRIAYLSNRGMDYYTQRSLWIYDTANGRRKKIKGAVGSSVSWSPDGRRLVYARHRLNRRRNRFFDLFVYDLDTRKEKQITRSRRIRQPDWKGDAVVCVVERDGVSNLAVVHPARGSFKQITDFHQGENIYLPRWMTDGRIVFAIGEENEGRDIAVVDADGSNFTYLIRTEHDERDPWPGPDGHNLYYSSDPTGIYNLYRHNLETGESVLMTNVTGGAFLPSVNRRGECVFSQFAVDGFKLALLDSLEPVDPDMAIYQSPYARLNPPPDSRSWPIAQFDDREKPVYTSRPYKPVYGKFMFFPRLLMDFPNKPKIGTYCYSSEFLDTFNFFGGVAVNTQFDKDIYGIFEYRKFYPTLFVELYQMSRQTKEENEFWNFDIDFNLLGVTLGADWLIDEMNQVRTAFDYSRYHNSGSGLHKYQSVFAKFSSTYHKGSMFSVRWKHRAIPPTLQSYIAPRAGRHFALQVDYAMQSFYDSTAASANYGTPVEVYNDFRYFQTQLDWHEFLPGLWKSHAIAARLRGGYIDRYVDPFYHFYAGGLDGMKGYPFYSMEGLKLAQIGLAYRFPLKRNMNIRLAMFHLRDAYLSFYGDIGDAWVHDQLKLKSWKKDAGIQLRLGMLTYYAFPMKISFDAAYGFDRFSVLNRTYGEDPVYTTYGREWRYYFTVLFDFLDLAESAAGTFRRR